MRKVIGFIYLIIATQFNSVAVADQSTYKRWVKDKVLIDATVNVWLRASEPSGLFCSRGKQLAVIEKGQTVTVRNYINAECGILFRYDYLEIEIVNPKSGQTPWGIVSAVNDDGSPLFVETITGGGE